MIDSILLLIYLASLFINLNLKVPNLFLLLFILDLKLFSLLLRFLICDFLNLLVKFRIISHLYFHFIIIFKVIFLILNRKFYHSFLFQGNFSYLEISILQPSHQELKLGWVLLTMARNVKVNIIDNYL